jgi:hypothetical protein
MFEPVSVQSFVNFHMVYNVYRVLHKFLSVDTMSVWQVASFTNHKRSCLPMFVYKFSI